MNGRSFGWLLGTALLLFGGVVESAEIRVETDPAGLDAWAAERYLGRTPLTATLPAGRFALRLVEPTRSLYLPPAVDTLLDLRPEDRVDLAFSVGRLVTVRSEPFDLPLMRDSLVVGQTPIHLRIDPTRTRRLRLWTPTGPVVVPMRTLLADGSWTWHGTDVESGEDGGGNRPVWRTVGRYVMPAMAGALFAAGLLMEDAADQAYERYQEAVEPSVIEEQYDRARRRDALASVLWISAEASLVSAIVSWILPERRESGDHGGGR